MQTASLAAQGCYQSKIFKVPETTEPIFSGFPKLCHGIHILSRQFLTHQRNDRSLRHYSNVQQAPLEFQAEN